MAPVEALKEAKKLIQTEGWIQSWSYLPPGSKNTGYRWWRNVLFDGPDKSGYCASGAITHVDTWNDEARHYLGLAVDGSLTSWNDVKGRKKNEVLAVFDKAILLAGGAK